MAYSVIADHVAESRSTMSAGTMAVSMLDMERGLQRWVGRHTLTRPHQHVGKLLVRLEREKLFAYICLFSWEGQTM